MDIKDYQKDYYNKNKEEITEYKHQWYLEHRDVIQEYNKVNKESIRKKSAIYYQNNKEKLSAYSREYNQTHKEGKREYQRKYTNNKRKNNAPFKLICSMRTRMWRILKRNSKAAHTLELLGCSPMQFKEHLELQFKPNMSWYNYGKWHIDHIIPCCTFDLSKNEEQKKCFHYTNLQPLWAIDNLKKHKTLYWSN